MNAGYCVCVHAVNTSKITDERNTQALAGQEGKKMNTIDTLWNKVNNCETVENCERAEKAIRAADINVDDFDELMMALTYLYREAYRAER